VAAGAHEIGQVCALAGRPDLAHIFVEQAVPAKAVIEFFLDQQKEGRCSSAGKVSMPKSPVLRKTPKVKTSSDEKLTNTATPELAATRQPG
jgi:hypothetical protein